MKIKMPQASLKSKPSGKNAIKAVLSTVALIAVFIVSLGVISGVSSPSRVNNSGELDQMYAVIDSIGGTYYGPLAATSYEGVGEFQHLDGGRYEGSFSDSVRSGEGVFTWTNGDSFQGTWRNDQMLSGVYTFADGSNYNGSFLNNAFSTGTFELGATAKKQGLASFQASYSQGELTSLDYQTTEGLTYSGKLDGFAEITYENGDTYTGNVKNGVRDGKGVYVWHDEQGKISSKYDGAWKNGVMEGTGTYYYSAASYPYITGTFVDGKPKGTAVYYKEAGNTFDTVWADGVCSKVTES